MDGIVYFSRHSLNLENWANLETIFENITTLQGVISEINLSNIAILRIPNLWADSKLNGLTFWEELDSLTNGNSEIMGYVSRILYDSVFQNSLDKNINVEQAVNRIINNNPDTKEMEYYAALKNGNNWPDVPAKLHVEDDESLCEFGLEFLQTHPHNEGSYFKRCCGLFGNLIFHPNVEKTLKAHGTVSVNSKYGKAPVTGISGFSISVANSLRVLNSIDLANKSTNEILGEIRANSEFKVSGEGADNARLAFDFVLGNQNLQTRLNCEYHIHISKNNRNDSTYFQDRLYFGFTRSDGERQIVIGHCGNHL